MRGERHILTTQLLCHCLQYSVITCQALSAGWDFFPSNLNLAQPGEVAHLAVFVLHISGFAQFW